MEVSSNARRQTSSSTGIEFHSSAFVCVNDEVSDKEKHYTRILQIRWSEINHQAALGRDLTPLNGLDNPSEIIHLLIKWGGELMRTNSPEQDWIDAFCLKGKTSRYVATCSL